MEKLTLQFNSLIELAKFSKVVTTGFLMNTNKNTVTGRFTKEEVLLAQTQFAAKLIETSEKVYSY